MTISHNGHTWKAKQLKSASLSTGYLVYLFERQMNTPFSGSFVVAVKSPLDRTVVWVVFDRLNRACEYYLGMLACYA